VKKLLIVLIVLCLLQIFWPTLQSFPTIQSKIVTSENIILNSGSIDIAGKVGGENADVQSNKVTLSIQDATGEIRSKDVTNTFKQSVGSTTVLQDGGATWAKTYGGSENDYCSPKQGIQQTLDGGYIIGGNTKSFGAGGVDFLIIKLKQDGTIEWAKTFGSIDDDWAKSIQQTKDGGYLVAGSTGDYYSHSGGSKSNLLILKLKQDGTIEWAKKFSESGDYIFPWEMQQTSDGGYIIGGEGYIKNSNNNVDFFIIKLKQDYSLEWAKAIGGSNVDFAFSIQQTKDSGYIASGGTKSFGVSGWGVLIVKIDSNGNLSQSKVFSGNYFEGCYFVRQTSDNGYIIAGEGAGSTSQDALTIKFKEDFSVDWAKAISVNGNALLYDIQQANDGGYVAAGFTKNEALILKLMQDGSVEWTKKLGINKYDGLVSVQQTIDGGYIIGGRTGDDVSGTVDILVLKLNSNGEIRGDCSYLTDSTPSISSKTIVLKDVSPQVKDVSLTESSPQITETVPDIKTTNICGGPIFTLTTKAGSGGSVSPSGSVAVDSGVDQTFTISSDSGYRIKDVLVDGVSVGTVSTYTFQNITSDHTIEAVFEVNTYTIKATSNIGGLISPSDSATVNYGSSQTFTITPNTGYTIKDVKVDEVSVGAVSTYTFENIADNHTIEATFEPITYTISALAGFGGYISPSGAVTVNYEESKIFTISPDFGYRISSVKVDGISRGTVSSYTFTNITSNHTIETSFEKSEIALILRVGESSFAVNGETRYLDSPPIIKNSRTLVPIRAVVESLGGTVGWDVTERKVTVSLGSTTIELWIGKLIAKVNDINTPIDPANPKVVPEIINSRTMLPLRFVTENLGCDVQWDGTTKTITITYQG